MPLGIAPKGLGIAPIALGIAPIALGIAPIAVGIAPIVLGIAPIALGAPPTPDIWAIIGSICIKFIRAIGLPAGFWVVPRKSFGESAIYVSGTIILSFSSIWILMSRNMHTSTSMAFNKQAPAL